MVDKISIDELNLVLVVYINKESTFKTVYDDKTNEYYLTEHFNDENNTIRFHRFKHYIKIIDNIKNVDSKILRNYIKEKYGEFKGSDILLLYKIEYEDTFNIIEDLEKTINYYTKPE